MIVTPVVAAPICIIPQNEESGPNRVLYVSNNGTNAATLLVDSGPQSALTASTGIPLVGGVTLRFGSTNAGDQDGNQAVYAFSLLGTTISVNAIVGKKTFP